jgi:hypothetical protein
VSSYILLSRNLENLAVGVSCQVYEVLSNVPDSPIWCGRAICRVKIRRQLLTVGEVVWCLQMERRGHLGSCSHGSRLSHNYGGTVVHPNLQEECLWWIGVGVKDEHTQACRSDGM